MGSKNKGKPHQKPTFQQSLVPKGERRPKETPGSYLDDQPRWLLQRVDFGGPWCWKHMDSDTMIRVWSRLCNFETMTFRDIEGKTNHPIPKERLGSEAQKRIIDIGMDEFDAFYSFRVSLVERVWGVKIPEGVLLLWWDPEHTVYPMNVTDN